MSRDEDGWGLLRMKGANRGRARGYGIAAVMARVCAARASGAADAEASSQRGALVARRALRQMRCRLRRGMPDFWRQRVRYLPRRHRRPGERSRARCVGEGAYPGRESGGSVDRAPASSVRRRRGWRQESVRCVQVLVSRRMHQIERGDDQLLLTRQGGEIMLVCMRASLLSMRRIMVR